MHLCPLVEQIKLNKRIKGKKTGYKVYRNDFASFSNWFYQQ